MRSEAIKLKKNDSFLPHLSGISGTLLENDISEYKIPKSVRTKFIVKYLDMHPLNTLYQKYLRKKISREDFLKKFPFSISDTLDMPKNPINSCIHILIYETNQSKCYIVDCNNNKDFTDDKIFVINKDSLSKNPKKYENLIQVKIKFQTYYHHKTYNTSNLYVIHPTGPFIKYSNDIENDLYCAVSYANIYTARLDKGFTLYILNNISLDIFDKKLYQITTQTSRAPYYVGDTVKNNDTSYRIDSIAKDYTKMYLTKFITKTPFTGAMEGDIAYGFNVQTFDNNLFSLSDQRGKYVLLDFWGTWCSPCLASIPQLKKIYTKYNDNILSILGVAVERNNDSIAFGNSLKKLEIPWKIFFQHSMNERVDSLLSFKYKVTFYPTYMLIDPNGIIIFRSSGHETPEKALLQIEFILNNKMNK